MVKKMLVSEPWAEQNMTEAISVVQFSSKIKLTETSASICLLRYGLEDDVKLNCKHVKSGAKTRKHVVTVLGQIGNTLTKTPRRKKSKKYFEHDIHHNTCTDEGDILQYFQRGGVVLFNYFC